MPSPENIFKDKLYREIRTKLHPCMVLKHNDSLNVGLPDLQVIKYGRSVFLEIKYTDRIYENIKGKVLHHPFSPKQILTAKRITTEAGAKYFGVIGFKSKEIICLYYDQLKDNFKKEEIRENDIYTLEELMAEIDLCIV